MTSFVFPAQGNGENTVRPEEACRRDRRKARLRVRHPLARLSDRPSTGDSAGSKTHWFGEKRVGRGPQAQLQVVTCFEQHIFSCFLFIVFILSQIKDTFWVVQGCPQLSKADDSHTAMQK